MCTKQPCLTPRCTGCPTRIMQPFGATQRASISVCRNFARASRADYVSGGVGADGGEGFEEADDCGEIAFGESGEAAARFGFDVLVDALEFEQARRIDVDEEAAAVVGVGLATDEAAFFEAVERDGDAPAGEAGGGGEAGGRRGAVELQRVNHLRVGEAEADLFRGLRVEEDAGGDELADLEEDAVFSGFGGDVKEIEGAVFLCGGLFP